jgi:hypothetical protein
VRQSSNNKKSLESIDFDHREVKFNEDSKDYKKLEIIRTDQIIVLEEASINLMSQQVMKMFTDHDHTTSQSLDYGSPLLLETISFMMQNVDFPFQNCSTKSWNST